MGSIRNDEEGSAFAGAILLLFFVSLFLFTLVSCHSNLYKTYDSLEIYYEKELIKTLNRMDEHEESLLGRIHGEW